MKARIKEFEFNFSTLNIKGKTVKGNIVSKYRIRKIVQKEIGESTLGGKDLWIDETVGKLNHDERGRYLGKFESAEKLLLIKNNGTYIILDVNLNGMFLMIKYVPLVTSETI